MPLPSPASWVPPEELARLQLSAQPPQYILDAIGGSYERVDLAANSFTGSGTKGLAAGFFISYPL